MSVTKMAQKPFHRFPVSRKIGAVLFVGFFVCEIGVWFLPGELSNKALVFVLAPFVFMALASLLLSRQFLEYDSAYMDAQKANPDGGPSAWDAAGCEAIRKACNCPNFVNNLGLPHLSDCPKFGEPRDR